MIIIIMNMKEQQTHGNYNTAVIIPHLFTRE